MNVNSIRLFWQYNEDMHRRVWSCIEHLSDEQFVHEFGYSLGSIRNHYVHLIGADSRWRGCRG